MAHIPRQPKAASQSSSATPARAPATPAPPPVQTPSAPAAPVPAPRSTPANVPDTPSPAGTATASGPNFNDPSALAMGAQREAAVSNMESMGFARADIDRAMRAAFFNPDRAVEYLLNVCQARGCAPPYSVANRILGYPREFATRTATGNPSPTWS